MRRSVIALLAALWLVASWGGAAGIAIVVSDWRDEVRDTTTIERKLSSLEGSLDTIEERLSKFETMPNVDVRNCAAAVVGESGLQISLVELASDLGLLSSSGQTFSYDQVAAALDLRLDVEPGFSEQLKGVRDSIAAYC